MLCNLFWGKIKHLKKKVSAEFSVGAVIGVNGSSLYRKSPPGANKEKQATFDLPVENISLQVIYALFFSFFFPTFPFHTGCCILLTYGFRLM